MNAPHPCAGIRVADAPAGVPVPRGVKPTACRKCQHPVYMAASSRRLIAAGVAFPVCFQCAATISNVVPVMTVEQRAELDEFGQPPERN